MFGCQHCFYLRALVVTFEHLRSSAKPNPSRSDIFIEPCRHGSRLLLSTVKGSNIWSVNRRQKTLVWFGVFWHSKLAFTSDLFVGTACGRRDEFFCSSKANSTFKEAWPPGAAGTFLVDVDMGVSKNRGKPPKWMVYNGKPYENGWFGGTTIFGNTHMAR